MMKLQTFFVASLWHLNIAMTISKPVKFEYQFHPFKKISKGIHRWVYRCLKGRFGQWQCGKRREIFPTIKNLNHLLKPFANQNCLIEIQNYQSIQIDNMDYPVILQHLALGSLQRKRLS